MFSSVTLRSSKLYFSNIFKRSISALYITGDKAHDTYSVLTPHLDFDERIQNKAELENNIKLRNLSINLDEIIRIWNFFQHVDSKRKDLENSKLSISQTIKKLSTKEDKYAEKINQLKLHGKMVKEDLKVLKESLWSVEEKAALKVLSLPNILHQKTPHYEEEIIHTFKQNSKLTSELHLEIGKKLDLIEYTNPYNFYLKNEAALFEIGLSFYIQEKLKEKDFILFSNSDFVRSVIVEGCGMNFSDPSKVFTILDESDEKHGNNFLHLIGSASLASFMAFYCRHSIFPSLFPLKYFSIGKKYQPVDSENESLLNVAQETSVNIFIANQDQEQMDAEFDKILQNAIQIYENLGYHFRIVYLSAKNLLNWESCRASIQLFSNYKNEYIEVGNISLCGDFISKRLLFNYGKNLDIKFPYIVTGTLISVPKLLACVLESNFKDKLLPDILEKYIN